ncbi:uncharacterized protein LOC129223180 [Uloborus diversus]|uniref:uncharacterized protein LOC129223180 n=1 Tax=Uloborus diversus TaxID=327109 RepID=UPI002409C91D|nr:uncharacterized protein LOC129223180 [Uloborus diversus]
MGCIGKVAEIINLSDESNSSFEMAPLGERIGLEDTKLESNMFKIKSVKPVHSISDSSESDNEPEIMLPDLDDLLSKSPILPTVKKLNQPSLKFEVTLSDTDEEFKESLANLPKRQKKTTTKVIDVDKAAEKDIKLKIREEKKREKELAKALKASEKEMQRSKKPEECLKSMKVVADHNIIFIDGAQDMFTVLDSNDIKYTVEENEVERSVIWFRTVSDISVESCRVVKEEREEIETVMIVLIPNKDFLNMVHSSVMI